MVEYATPALVSEPVRFNIPTSPGQVPDQFKVGREVVFIASRFKGNCRSGMEKSFQMAGVKVYWGHTSNEQEAWRCVDGRRLGAATSLPPDRFADVGLARLVASGHRLRR